jgi:hypothetical protein
MTISAGHKIMRLTLFSILIVSCSMTLWSDTAATNARQPISPSSANNVPINTDTTPVADITPADAENLAELGYQLADLTSQINQLKSSEPNFSASDEDQNNSQTQDSRSTQIAELESERTELNKQFQTITKSIRCNSDPTWCQPQMLRFTWNRCPVPAAALRFAVGSVKPLDSKMTLWVQVNLAIAGGHGVGSNLATGGGHFCKASDERG